MISLFLKQYFWQLINPMAYAVKLDDLNPTRRSLLLRLKDWQDQESWRQFFDTYWRLVYSVALRAGLTETEAEDAVQETFVAVAKKIGDFNYDPAIGSFKGWLIHTTQWRVADQLRKRKNLVRPVTSTRTTARTATIDRIPDPASLDLNKLCEEEWEANLFLLAVEKIKDQVNPKHFQIFDLYVLKKWPAGKVAQTLGVSSALVHLTKHRIAKLVKQQINLLRKKSI
jgi:RNA polymerase sigma factor (sigma-70 family)